MELLWKHHEEDEAKSAQMSSLLFNILFVCDCWATFLPYVALPHLDLIANVSRFDLVCFFWFAKSYKHSPPPRQPDESQRDINIAKYCWLIRKSFQLFPSGVAIANWFACLLWDRVYFCIFVFIFVYTIDHLLTQALYFSRHCFDEYRLWSHGIKWL